MKQLLLMALLGTIICPKGIAEGPASALPDAPAPDQSSSSTTPSTNTIQSSVGMVLMLEKKSVVFPDLATHKERLSGWDKCKLAANTSVAPSTVASALLGSAVGQLRDTPKGYGQGAAGYGKRLGADLARSASYNAFGPCLIATATGEDPRFFVRENLSLGQALKYAAVRLVYTRSDTGQRVFNFSGIGGSLAAETLANLYYPAGSRGVGNTMTRFSVDIATRYAGHMLRQYLPVIDHRLKLSAKATGSDTNR